MSGLGMFSFIQDMGNYDQRAVARNDYPWGMIDTCSVSDGAKPYETAVAHTDYIKAGEMVIVEAYDTAAEAKAGHARWVRTMTAKKLPAQLVDCNNSQVGALAAAVGCKTVHKRKARKAKAKRA